MTVTGETHLTGRAPSPHSLIRLTVEEVDILDLLLTKESPYLRRLRLPYVGDDPTSPPQESLVGVVEGWDFQMGEVVGPLWSTYDDEPE